MDDFIQSIFNDLKTELQITDENFNANVLMVKVRNALREVLQELGYSGMLDNDAYESSSVEKYYSNIRNIALYDYNLVGGEFSSSITENSNKREFVDRNKLFSGIYPQARF